MAADDRTTVYFGRLVTTIPIMITRTTNHFGNFNNNCNNGCSYLLQCHQKGREHELVDVFLVKLRNKTLELAKMI